VIFLFYDKYKCRNCGHDIAVNDDGVFHAELNTEATSTVRDISLTVTCPVEGCVCPSPEKDNEPTRELIEVIPSARRLMGSLRDEGYNFVTAAADIIDNSIQAGAKEIRILMEFNGDHSWFQIADDGKGMTGAELTEAMRFGSEREYEANELGKFGLGLKTASISQCRKLTVASRSATHGNEIEIRQLNIDRIMDSNRWEIISISKEDYSDILWKYLIDHHGTIVMWESLDRMMQYDPPDGMRARKGFVRLARDLEKHIRMIFHRFLSGELGDDRKISISINGTPLEPWDPFARKEKTVKVAEKTIAVVGYDNVFKVHYTAYVLPPKEKFSSSAAFSDTAGPKGWNLQQGFYIYRENRMIQSGGWCRMRVPDEHTKLARIALDLGKDADFSLGLNIMKTSITLPPNLKADLEPMVASVIKQARGAYEPEKNRTPPVSTNPPTIQQQSEPIGRDIRIELGRSESSFTGPVSSMETDQPRVTEKISKSLASSLERAAVKAGETDALRRIRMALIKDDPIAASKIGW